MDPSSSRSLHLPQPIPNPLPRMNTPTYRNNETMDDDDDDNNALSNEGICAILYSAMFNQKNGGDPTNDSTVSSNILIRLIHTIFRHFYLVSLVITLGISFLPSLNNTYGTSQYEYWITSTVRWYGNGNSTTTSSSSSSNVSTNFILPTNLSSLNIVSLPMEDIVVLSTKLSQTILLPWSIRYSREISLFFIALTFFIQGILYSWSISTLHHRNKPSQTRNPSSTTITPASFSLEPTPEWKFNLFNPNLQTILGQYLKETVTTLQPSSYDTPVPLTNSKNSIITQELSLSVSKGLMNPLRSSHTTSLSPLKNQEKILFHPNLPPNNGNTSFTTGGSKSNVSSTNSASYDPPRRPTYLYVPPYRHPTTGQLIPGGWIESTIVQSAIQQHTSIFEYIYYPCTCVTQYISNFYKALPSVQNFIQGSISHICVPCVSFYRYAQKLPFLTIVEILHYIVMYLAGPYIFASSLGYYFGTHTSGTKDYVTSLCLTIGFVVFFITPSIFQVGDGTGYAYRHIDTDYEKYFSFQRINKIKKALLYLTLFSFLAPSILQSSWQVFDDLFRQYTVDSSSSSLVSMPSTAEFLSIGDTTGTLLAVTLLPFWIPILVSSVYRLSGISSIPFCLRFSSSYLTLVCIQQICICIAIVTVFSSYPLLTFWLRQSTKFTHSSTYTDPTVVNLSSVSTVMYLLHHPIVGIFVGISCIFLVILLLPVLFFIGYGLWLQIHDPKGAITTSKTATLTPETDTVPRLPSLSSKHTTVFYHPIYIISRYTAFIEMYYLSHSNRFIATGVALALSLAMNEDTIAMYTGTKSNLWMDTTFISPLLSLLPSSAWYNKQPSSSIDNTLEISIIFIWIRYTIVLTMVLFTCFYHIIIYFGDKCIYRTKLGYYLRNPVGLQSFVPESVTVSASQVDETMVDSVYKSTNNIQQHQHHYHLSNSQPSAFTSVSAPKPLPRNISNSSIDNSNSIHPSNGDVAVITPTLQIEPIVQPTVVRQIRRIIASPEEATNGNPKELPNISIDIEESEYESSDVFTDDSHRDASEEDDNDDEEEEEESVHASTVQSSLPIYSFSNVPMHPNASTNNAAVLSSSAWSNYIQSVSSLTQSMMMVGSNPSTVVPTTKSTTAVPNALSGSRMTTNLPVLQPVPDPSGKAPFILVPLSSLPPTLSRYPTVTESNDRNSPLRLSALRND